MVILLSIVTCGIYYYIWMYQTSEEVNNTIGDTSESAGTEVLLTIITCGIYGYYWIYKYNRKVYQLATNVNLTASDNSLVCIILAIFGLAIVSQGIMQSQINYIVDNHAPQA